MDNSSQTQPSATGRTTSFDPTTLADIPDVRATSSEKVRPSIEKQWQTERPQRARFNSILENPRLKRNPTHASALNEAIWNSPGCQDDSTTSSDDDEDEPQGGNAYSRFNVGNDHYNTKGHVSKRDGRLNISVHETDHKGYLAKALGANIFQRSGPSPVSEAEHEGRDHDHAMQSRKSSEATITSNIPRPTLNIVVMVIGSRGDIQPFLKLGKSLKEYGHRVRIATHPAFKDFVQKDSGLEFFSVGGDPAELMAFMVKNPGMIPTMETLKKGDVGRRRDQMAEMFEGFWRACINATDDEKDISNLKMMGQKAPFVADAIIANPPSFAHIHCAERLGIPLHLMFTFPYTPTQAFPHPLANIKRSNVDPGYANFMSYPLVEMMTWQGLGDLVNNFRVKTLGLEPVSTLWAPGQLYRLKVPYTYLWSPGLVPKPEDWGPEIDIAGFVFLDLASSFKPPEDLVKFLDAGEPPIYIGFGSIVVDDPDKFTKMIFEAVKKAGVRALVSKGWGGLGDDNTPDDVYMLENTPHDWLFPKVKAVVHHGGAGTTAIGLKCGKPTMVVPFFGDQQFWGSMIGEAGAGAKPVPYKELDSDKLAEGIKQLLTEDAAKAAQKIADSIEKEGDGAQNAVTSFHRSLVLRGQHSMRCSFLEDRVAVWSLKNTNLRLSALAAELLVERKKITWKQLRLIRHNEWNDFEGPGEPISGGTTAIMGSLTSMATGIGSIPFKIRKSTNRRAKHEEKKLRHSEEVRRRSKNMRGNGKNAMVNGKERSKSTPNGRPQQKSQIQQPNGPAMKGRDNECEPGRENEAGQSDFTDTIPAEKAPGTGMQKAALGPDMGKKSTSGEPMAQMSEAQSEAEHEDDEDNEDNEDEESDLSDDPDTHPAEDVAHDVGEGLGKTAEAFARMPMDLSLAIAQGFHNAPRLYGDTTVRRPARITGMRSGLKAAGKEFVFGVYDGVTGLVVQPYTGARDAGPVGFVKGVGMGLTGFVLKDLSAIFGPFGYTFKGVHKELLKHKQPTHFIRKARIMEGQRDLGGLDEKEKTTAIEIVNHAWGVVQQIWALQDEKRSQGIRGKLHVMRERKMWHANGAFENVDKAEKALAAKSQGESLEEIFGRQREELNLAQKPRKNVVEDLRNDDQEGVEDVGQVVQKNQESKKPTRDMPHCLV